MQCGAAKQDHIYNKGQNRAAYNKANAKDKANRRI